MSSETPLNIKILADGADRDGIIEMYNNPQIAGFTTNPTLMRKAGISDYRAFALDILKEVPDRPISFEVFSDEFPEMERQAMEIVSWGDNVYAIPTELERIHDLPHRGPSGGPGPVPGRLRRAKGQGTENSPGGHYLVPLDTQPQLRELVAPLVAPDRLW